MACFHATCFRFKLDPITPALLAATYHRFQPAMRESQRLARILRFLLPRLSDQLPRLPGELVVMVARLLVRECGVVTTQEQTPAGTDISCLACFVNVTLTRDVYARFCRIDGIRYIQTLQNAEPGPAQGEWQLLFRAQKGPVSRVLVAEDHLGIRLIRFILPDSPDPPSLDIPGTWWRDVSIHAVRDPTLQGRTDVRKTFALLYLRELS